VNKLAEIWQFRSYILGSVKRDFSLRYTGSVLGAALVFLVPALQISLYVVVFGNLLKNRLPGNPTFYGYSIYLCCGILLWNFFTELLQRTQNVYLDNANLIKKAAFPRSVLSIVNVCVALVNLGLAMALLLAFLLVTGVFPGLSILGLLPIVVVIAALALSIGLCVAVLQVFFRDFGALMGIALQLLFWGTPIVYPLQILPGWFVPWLQLNPLLAPVATAQAILLGTSLPETGAWYSTLLIGVVAALLGYRLHARHHADLLDNL